LDSLVYTNSTLTRSNTQLLTLHVHIISHFICQFTWVWVINVSGNLMQRLLQICHLHSAHEKSHAPSLVDVLLAYVF